MIPNIVHFNYGLEEQKEDFLFSYYLAVLSCSLISRPEKIFFYFTFEPKGIWWQKTKSLVTPVPVKVPDYFGSKKIIKTAHKSDVLRMFVLHKQGGIYLDIDTITVRNYKNLLSNNFVISQEITECGVNMGFSNAIMMSVPNGKFMNVWLSNYEKHFKPEGWQEASTILPQLIYSKFNDPANVTLLPSDCFVRPSFRKIENIFENEIDIPKELLVLHLWNQYSKNKYLKNIKDFSWAIKNSHTLYGKTILNLMSLL